jgi:putative membrane-bound dehydrogenase-like protein
MKAILCSLLAAFTSALAVDGNRLTYLDDDSPFWPTNKPAKFVTPQWIGEPGVEAAVILAIDDMREPAKYEAFLRPILERLKQIDGRAPVSIMTCEVKPDDPQLAAWLREGLSFEVHTLTHPCPCLGKATFDEAARIYHDCVDLLSSIPGNKPVAFRMPCCDSMNSASPRFFAEIFNHTSTQGHWLAIDSSVFMRFSDPRFAKYYPAELRPPTKVSLADYAGWIEDYPYPFVIGKLCWEFPCITPSDWQASNSVGSKTQVMLDDWKAALDGVVRAQGVFTAVFHPHGWSAPEQWVEFIDYAERTYGKRVKFLTFREALERLEKNALDGHPLRASNGGDNGVRLLDLDADGFMDVIIGALAKRVTRTWRPREQRWQEGPTPVLIATPVKDDGQVDEGVRFGVIRASGEATMLVKSGQTGAWSFRDGSWQADNGLLAGLDDDFRTGKPGFDSGVRLRDFDGDGRDELLANRTIFSWDEKELRWKSAGFTLPEGVNVIDAQGHDNGLRFVDLNGDGFDDVFQSNDRGVAIYLWAAKVREDLGWKRGWSHLVRRGIAENALPFVHDGRDYGAWFHRGHVVWQNEDTVAREAYTLRRSFRDIIAFDMPPPKSPADSLASLVPRPGFTVELVASEPLIVDPVAFDWDAEGRLWVVEMRDYPLGMDGNGKPGGVIKVLTDEDGDGHYDKATVFLENLPFPTGVMPWRNGALIAATPDILFAADTDGDGRADQRRVLFTGFKEGNQQHRMNGFEWGLDGWIYGANGDSGGRINGVNISGRDFRFRPDGGELEAESGNAQYGRHRDDWGHWFGNNNPTWLWHYTLEDRYLRRNPRLAVKTTKQMLANYDDPTRVFTAYDENNAPIRFNQPQSLGHVTSANSPTPYRDELFGPEFATSVFISEPVHNVVHREVLEPNGATFTSRRAADEKSREFLASKDQWFRPTMLKTGPDGALYIADMYRFVLEHPEWIAPETQARLDLRAGSDKGRIYRVFPTGAKLRPIPNLAKLDNTALAAALDNPNGWQRDTVQRLLFERQAREVGSALQKLVTSASNAKARLQALATLDVLGVIDAEIVRTAIRDAHPAVRAYALRVSESLPAFEPSLLACQDDPDFAVRRQLAFTLGTWRDARAQMALAHLVDRDGDHEQMRVAILSSLPPDSALFAKLNTAPLAASAHVPELPKPTTTDRAKVIASYAKVGELKGDAVHGRTLIQQQCAICHRFKGEGQDLGPDLGMVAAKPLDWLLAAIFDPNAAIEPRYQAQTVRLKSGAEFTGLIVAETTNNVTLRLPGGTEQAVLRNDLAEQKATGHSLMPEGLEGALQPQDVADVIAALRAQ